jgi:hypothetical protein
MAARMATSLPLAGGGSPGGLCRFNDCNPDPRDIHRFVMALGVREAAVFDPLLHEIDLALSARQYPLGFPLQICTNSHEVLRAAQVAWGSHRPAFDRQPLQIRAVVQEEGSAVESPPAFRSQGRQIAIVYDRDNFAVCDAASRTAWCFVSQRTAADDRAFRFHFLEAMAYLLLCQSYAVPVHAACIAREGSGLLLCGPSASGKSTLAFACARAGWTFVCDDATWLVVDAEDRTAIGNSHQARFREDAPRFFPELAGYAVLQRPNGKLSLEVPTADFPQISTATECSIGGLVLLDRGGSARLESLRPEAVVRQLLCDMPSYGPEVREMYERTLSRLEGLPAWSMGYTTLEEALCLLERTP